MVYDVMIHDLDILLALVDAPVISIHALGIPVVTDKVDIAHARLRIRFRRRRQSHRQPRLRGARAQVALLPGARIYFRGLYAGAMPCASASCSRARSRNLISSSYPFNPRSRSKANCALLDAVRTSQHACGGWPRRPPSAGLGRPGDGGHPGTQSTRPTGGLDTPAVEPRLSDDFDESSVSPDARSGGNTGCAPPRRLTTLLDERTIVAANLPRVQLDTHTTIPAHLPLDVLASRIVVPRDMPSTPFDPDHPSSGLCPSDRYGPARHRADGPAASWN